MSPEVVIAFFLIASVATFIWQAEKKTQSVRPGKDGRKGYKRRNPNRYDPVKPKGRTKR